MPPRSACTTPPSPNNLAASIYIYIYIDANATASVAYCSPTSSVAYCSGGDTSRLLPGNPAQLCQGLRRVLPCATHQGTSSGARSAPPPPPRRSLPSESESGDDGVQLLHVFLDPWLARFLEPLALEPQRRWAPARPLGPGRGRRMLRSLLSDLVYVRSPNLTAKTSSVRSGLADAKHSLEKSLSAFKALMFLLRKNNRLQGAYYFKCLEGAYYVFMCFLYVSDAAQGWSLLLGVHSLSTCRRHQSPPRCFFFLCVALPPHLRIWSYLVARYDPMRG